jgi:hypothetical protein
MLNGQIFISYRRDDTCHLAGRIYDRLRERFPKSKIFYDIDTLRAGEDFVEAIKKSVGFCDAFIAIIGKGWLDSSDEKGRRIDNPDDFVRLEISAALERDIQIIPVLGDGAAMPKSNQLPPELERLARILAIEISYSRFESDSEQQGCYQRKLGRFGKCYLTSRECFRRQF